MPPSPENSTATADWLEQLQRPETYGEDNSTAVTLHETHISWIFLCGDCAYKLKKPICNDFVDYSTAAKRKACCEEEIRLNGRYVDGLYLDVIRFHDEQGRLRINGDGPIIEYGVRMKRFAEDALLQHRLGKEPVSGEEMRQLADSVADFHARAERAEHSQPFGTPEEVLDEALANFTALANVPLDDQTERLDELAQWTRQFHQENSEAFAQRLREGFVRECHGDLHTGNVILWQQGYVPFDGIEFNPALRWIDVLADVAFLGMDLASQGHPQLGQTFLNRYLEQTGDYRSLQLYRFYVVYRSLVRAKVAAMRSSQEEGDGAEQEADLRDCRQHLELAWGWTRPAKPSLWITHGVSGSGKSTGSESIVQRDGAIRIRSDVERKRMSEQHPGSAPPSSSGSLYSEEMTQATYQRLEALAEELLRCRYPVVVDATFLKRSQRSPFAKLAESLNVPFGILRFSEDEAVLRQRLRRRADDQHNVSDADLRVLEQQQRSIEKLTAAEEQVTTDMSSSDANLNSL